MRIFISWSGSRSHQVARALGSWLATYKFTCFISSEIEKGSRWLPAVEAELKKADAGLVCLTPASLDSGWVKFEAGALATAVGLRIGEPRLFTYLLGVPPSAVPDPLSAYQSTVATAEDTFRLINGLLRLARQPPISPREFSKSWDRLDDSLRKIPPEPVTSVFPGLADLFDRKTFREPVDECVDRAWFARYAGATETHDMLRKHQELVQAECGVAVADLYRQLLGELDAYGMNMRSLLFNPISPELTPEGRVEIPTGPFEALERRRLAINRLTAQLTDQRQQPTLNEAVRFEQAVSFAERKSVIHRLEREMERDAPFARRLAESVAELRDSDWTLDRVASYLVGEREAGRQNGAVAAVLRELEVARAAAAPSLVALHYSLRWMRSCLERAGTGWTSAALAVASVRSRQLRIHRRL
jgi:hypothetical protein